MPARGEERSWDVVYYRQADGQTPAIDFLDGCPIKLQARFDAVLDDVAAALPPRYSGGGRWEAMHGDMSGFYEVRLGGPNREQFRLFCILDNGSPQHLHERGLPRPRIRPSTFHPIWYSARGPVHRGTDITYLIGSDMRPGVVLGIIRMALGVGSRLLWSSNRPPALTVLELADALVADAQEDAGVTRGVTRAADLSDRVAHRSR